MLRHGTVEGFKELSKHFQIVIYTMLNELLCHSLINLFDKEGIVFDALYQKVQNQKNKDEYCSYQQIYIDLETVDNKGDTDFQKVEKNILVISPICLDN